jgi:uncharacterized protein (TIGR02300 family)
MSCGARFYDLAKHPIICPSCNTTFTGEIKVKARRGRVADIEDDGPVAVVEVEEVVAEESDAETVSLEEVEEDSDDDEIEVLDEDIDDMDDDDIDEDIAEDDDEDEGK